MARGWTVDVWDRRHGLAENVTAARMSIPGLMPEGGGSGRMRRDEETKIRRTRKDRVGELVVQLRGRRGGGKWIGHVVVVASY